MSESFTEISYNSYPKRVIGSILFALISPIFIVLLFYFFIFFENQFKLKQMGLSEAGNKVVSVSCQVVDEKNAKKVIHLTGKITSSEIVEDKRFNVKFNALKVVRRVEMYQWEESRTTSEAVLPGGSSVSKTTYKYKKVWSRELIDSSEFRKTKYRNPTSFRIQEAKLCVNQAGVGAFEVSGPHIYNMEASRIQLKKKPKPEKGKYAGKIYLTKAGEIFVGSNPETPKIGDHKVSYEVARPGVYSLIGEQAGIEVTPFVSQENVRLAVIRKGTYKANDLIKVAKEEVSYHTWVLRLIAWIFYTLFVYLILNPFAVLADVIPWLGGVKRLNNFVIAMGTAVLLSAFTVYVGLCHFSQAVEIGGHFGHKIVNEILTDISDAGN